MFQPLLLPLYSFPTRKSNNKGVPWSHPCWQPFRSLHSAICLFLSWGQPLGGHSAVFVPGFSSYFHSWIHLYYTFTLSVKSFSLDRGHELTSLHFPVLVTWAVGHLNSGGTEESSRVHKPMLPLEKLGSESLSSGAMCQPFLTGLNVAGVS